MNNDFNETSSDREGGGEMPADLARIGRQLDLLGGFEQAGAPADLDARVFDASRLARVEQKLDEIGGAERRGAPAALEPRVHLASRGELPGRQPMIVGAPELKLTGDRADRPVAEVMWRGWAVRVAAAFVLAAAGFAAYLSTGPSAAPNGPGIARGGPASPGILPSGESVDESVFALLASIDSATMGDQMEMLSREAEGLSSANLSESPAIDRLLEGAM